MASSTGFMHTSIMSKTTATNNNGEKATAMPPQENAQNCDILLSNFKIKNRRYRVLFNCDHIVWERLQTKCSTRIDESSSKRGEQESHQPSYQADYGSYANVVHINNIIRVSKGNTKQAALNVEVSQKTQEFGAGSISNTQKEEKNRGILPTELYLAIVYAERIIHSVTDCNRWEVRKLVLYNADAYTVLQWHDLLNNKVENSLSTRLRVRRLMVFINPYGGRKNGLRIYEQHCKPLFKLAGIDASCIISQRSNQIRDILLSHDLTPFDAVCCVGGDGTVAEVINGLIFRTIRDEGMDPCHPPYVPKPALPIAIIPAGSTDTVVYSLHGTSDVCTAAIHLILGQRRGMDICSVRNREGIVRFFASLLSYGYLGDIAAKSERYRWMGTKRYEYAGFKTFLANKGYEAELRILQPECDINLNTKKSSTKETAVETDDTICCADCIRCKEAAMNEVKRENVKKAMLQGTATRELDNDDLPSLSKVSSKSWDDNRERGIKTSYNTECLSGKAEHFPKNNNDAVEFEKMKKIDCDCENGEKYRTNTGSAIHKYEKGAKKSDSSTHWKKINGKFFMISGANITCACTRSPNGLARYSHIGDGYLDLILVRKTSFPNNVRLLLNMISRNGDLRNLSFVETFRTKRFCFRSPSVIPVEDYSISGSCQPIAPSNETYMDNDDKENVSSWNCDGEVVLDQELTIISHCQLIEIFMRGPHTYRETLQNDRKSLLCCCCCCGKG